MVQSHPVRRYAVPISIVCVATLAAISGIYLRNAKQSQEANGPLPASTPTQLRSQLIDQVASEQPEAMLDQLTSNLADIAYAATGSGLDLHDGEGTYKYAVAVVPKLNRVRRLLQIFQTREDRPVKKLRSMFVKACSVDYDDLDRRVDQQGRDPVPPGFPKTYWPLRDEQRKLAIEAHVAVYLLAQWASHDSLPTMMAAYDRPGTLPVPRLYLFYAMHMLVASHPRDKLSRDARAALDDYIGATRGRVLEAEAVAVPTWDAPLDETDFRVAILNQPLPDKTKMITLRQFPVSFFEYEDSLSTAGDEPRRHIYRKGLAVEIHDWYAKMRRFCSSLIRGRDQVCLCAECCDREKKRGRAR